VLAEIGRLAAEEGAESAPWLPILEAELFSFPGGRHDDQVDSISQALAHTGGYDSTLSWVS
jgi:phage terminase large subunit-like protein